LSSSGSTGQTITSVGTNVYSSISFFNTTTGYGYDIGFGGSASVAPNSFYIYGGSSAGVKLVVNSSGNVGIGTSSPINTLQVNGAITVSGALSTLIATSVGTMDYSGGLYRFFSLGVNTSAPGGFAWYGYSSDTGVGAERMRIASAGRVTIGSAVASTNVELYLNGVTSKAQRIGFQESGVDAWLIGQGAASETSAFEIYNTNGQMSLSIAKATSNATFGGNIIVSPVTNTNSAYLLNTNASGNFFFAIDNSTGASFTGKIYSARAYNRALSQSEILQNYHVTKQRFGFNNIVGNGLVLNLNAQNNLVSS
jgi:hypothetical protein